MITGRLNSAKDDPRIDAIRGTGEPFPKFITGSSTVAGRPVRRRLRHAGFAPTYPPASRSASLRDQKDLTRPPLVDEPTGARRRPRRGDLQPHPTRNIVTDEDFVGTAGLSAWCFGEVQANEYIVCHLHIMPTAARYRFCVV